MLESFEIFNTHAFDTVGMVTKLAEIIMRVAVECIDTATKFLVAEQASKRSRSDGLAEITANVIGNEILSPEQLQTLCHHGKGIFRPERWLPRGTVCNQNIRMYSSLL